LTAGHVFGSLASYFVGRAGDRFVTNKFDRTKKLSEVHEKLKKWYAKYGNFTVFLARFVGYVRPWSSFIAGFAKVDVWPFLIWTALGSLLFNVITLYFSGIFILIWRKYSNLHLIFIIISMILFFGLIIYELIAHFLSSKRATKVEK
jgi:membrane protein DedA with SNARE-associated domain